MDVLPPAALILLAAVLGWLAASARRVRPPRRGPEPDPELGRLHDELRRLQQLVQETERRGAEAFGMLGAHIRAASEQTARLADTTGELREALSSSRARGQWGERMASDVLRLAGFVEGVNYVRQRGIEGGGVPDFTFLLPRGLSLHMDVKFPLDNYLRFLRAADDTEREAARTRFLADVRVCLRGLAERGYGEPSAAVDCVLLFIPNEQLFAFVQEQDPTILDEALRRRIVLCSPMTLFAVLAVVRQAVEDFALERTAHEMRDLLSRFAAQWGRYTDELDRFGRQLDTLRRTWDELSGPRRRQLERPLEQLEELRHAHGSAPADAQSSPVPAAVSAE